MSSAIYTDFWTPSFYSFFELVSVVVAVNTVNELSIDWVSVHPPGQSLVLPARPKIHTWLILRGWLATANRWNMKLQVWIIITIYVILAVCMYCVYVCKAPVPSTILVVFGHTYNRNWELRDTRSLYTDVIALVPHLPAGEGHSTRPSTVGFIRYVLRWPSPKSSAL